MCSEKSNCVVKIVTLCSAKKRFFIILYYKIIINGHYISLKFKIPMNLKSAILNLLRNGLIFNLALYLLSLQNELLLETELF